MICLHIEVREVLFLEFIYSAGFCFSECDWGPFTLESLGELGKNEDS